MMMHPFAVLRPELEHLLALMKITRPRPIDEGCHRIVTRGLDVYRELGAKTNVPPVLLAALDLREGDCNPATGIGQGDRWDRVSTHVPRGKGPFASWLAANIYYVRYDHLDSTNGLVPPGWTWAFAVYKSNAWNGWGPNAHGRHSGYPWSCTNIYDEATDGKPAGGKYVADGRWDPAALDRQPGTVPVMLQLARAYPDLAIAPAPAASDQPVPPVRPLPPGLPGISDTAKLQAALNTLLALDPPLIVDGNFGRMTPNGVRQFQRAHGLAIDGIPGPATMAALESARAAAHAHAA